MSATGIEWRIECKNPDSTGGLTDWHYYGAPMSEEQGIESIARYRNDPDKGRREFRLSRRHVTITYTDWTEVST
jgi:hypothetical protein